MGIQLRGQGTTVRAPPKGDPREVARQTAEAILADEFEILADDTTRAVKSALPREVIDLYGQLAA